MKQRIYKAFGGLETGDRIKPSWSGPYEVIDITVPRHREDGWHYVSLHSLPIFSIICGVVPSSLRYPTSLSDPAGWINGVHWENGQLRSYGDEIVVEKAKPLYDQIVDMFASYLQPADSADVWQPGVDYADDRRVFNCKECARDFNGEYPINRHHAPYCPSCGFVSRPVYVYRYEQSAAHINPYARLLRGR